MALAEQLKTYRKQAGFSQTAVAEELNISRQSISKWENGRGYPDIDNLVLLSKMYEVSIDELLKENKELKKKIVSNEIEISAKRQTLKFIKGTLKSDNDEGLFLLIISAISVLVFPIGFIIIPFIIFRNKKTNTLHKLVYVICVCSLFLHVYDGYIHLANIFNWGDSSIVLMK